MRSVRRFFSHSQNWAGFLLLLLFLATAVAAPWLSPMDPKSPGYFKVVGRTTDNQPYPPGNGAILGTLPRQFDVFHTLVWGTRAAFRFGLVVSLSAFVFGIFFGAVSAYAGGLINSLMMRVADAFLTVPILTVTVFLQQIVAVSVESLGGFYLFNSERLGRVVDYAGASLPPLVEFIERTDPLIISLILFSWMPYARLVNALVIILKQADYVTAARALGGGFLWVIRRHLIPNAIGPALVVVARDIGYLVILQATFTFIGIGSGSPWGTLLSYGRNWVIGPGGNILQFWWVFVPGTLAVILFGITWNLLGDGLNDLISTSDRVRLIDDTNSLDDFQPNSILLTAGRLAREKTTSVRTDMPAPPPPPARINPVLSAARRAALSGELKEAARLYIDLIPHTRDLDTIVVDLVKLARRYPRESRVWIALGDALIRSGKRDDGLKAYAQARRSVHEKNGDRG